MEPSRQMGQNLIKTWLKRARAVNNSAAEKLLEVLIGIVISSALTGPT